MEEEEAKKKPKNPQNQKQKTGKSSSGHRGKGELWRGGRERPPFCLKLGGSNRDGDTSTHNEKDEQVYFFQMSPNLLSKTRVGLSAGVGGRLGRTFSYGELIHRVLRMTKKLIKLNQVTEAAGEGKSAWQACGFPANSRRGTRTEVDPLCGQEHS